MSIRPPFVASSRPLSSSRSQTSSPSFSLLVNLTITSGDSGQNGHKRQENSGSRKPTLMRAPGLSWIELSPITPTVDRGFTAVGAGTATDGFFEACTLKKRAWVGSALGSNASPGRPPKSARKVLEMDQGDRNGVVRRHWAARRIRWAILKFVDALCRSRII